ncbi:sodium:solute symporter family transporter [Treponema sp. R6D11]
MYVVVGGYFATAANDFFQGLIMLFGIFAGIAAVLHSNGGFFYTFWKKRAGYGKKI